MAEERKKKISRAMQKNNCAYRHGAYFTLKKLDGRSSIAKAINHIEAELCTALGGDPTPQQTLILKTVAVKAVRLTALEHDVLLEQASERAFRDYLAWSKSMREDLRLLGLERCTRPVETLQTYISATAERVD